MKFDRLMQVLKLAVIAGTCITTCGFLVAEFIPWPCARLFTTDPELIRLSVNGMRIMMAAFVLVGSQMVITNFFQSIGMAKISMFLSLSRQMIFLLPMLLLLPLFLGVDGIWWAMPISDTIAEIVAVVMMMTYMRKFKEQHKLLIEHGEQ